MKFRMKPPERQLQFLAAVPKVNVAEEHLVVIKLFNRGKEEKVV